MKGTPADKTLAAAYVVADLRRCRFKIVARPRRSCCRAQKRREHL
jgi:hypothetical protein